MNIDLKSEFLNKTFIVENFKKQRTVADYLNVLIKNYLLNNKYSFIEDRESIIIDNYIFNIKSRNLNKSFNMGNLISCNKFVEYLQSDKFPGYIFIDYVEVNNGIKITYIEICLLSQIDRNILHVQNLGTGQIQLKPNSKIKIDINNDFNEYILTEIYKFYDKLIQKTIKRKNNIRELLNG